MARFNAENIEQYGSQSSNTGSYFSLKADKETARVRFLYNGAEDIEGFSVHKVTVGDRDRYVNCLRNYDDPMDKCPFCQAKFKLEAKMFVPLYNEDTNQFQIWERGKKFYGQLSGLCARYPNLVARTFDIERNGKPKDTGTTYNIFPVGDSDGTTVEDILDDLQMDSLPNPIGTIILDKTADDMEEFIATGSFADNSQPIRRRGADSSDEDSTRGRRNTNRGRGDRF